MPKGPQGQKRPGDVIGNAIKVAKIATGEEEDSTPSQTREGGLKGGKSRSKSLTGEQKSEIAKLAANARWGKNKSTPPKQKSRKNP
ncbi:MAG: RNA-binding protein [Nitrospirales bacterium]